MNPLVSILIPVYNREHPVVETIESAIHQTYTNIEIIIVDNCSTDNTWSVLQDFSRKDDRIKIFQNPENVGPVRNWKRCIDESSGEYAKILFSDDLISKDFLEEAMNVFEDVAAFVISPIQLFGIGFTNKRKNYT
jgi:glycosyltransferase involved in cell wall biosynthesis